MTNGGGRYRVRQRLTAGVGVLTLVALVLALNFYRLPVVALTPGPMEDVLARVKIHGKRDYDSKGKLYLTSVGVDDNVRFYEALLDLANRDVQLLPREQVFPDGGTAEEIDQENVALMDQSKETAKVVALRELGYDVKPTGVVVTETVPGAPADGRLEAGDRIVAVDERGVTSIEQVRKAITRHQVGERVAFRIDRDRATKEVAVRVQAAEGQPRVGVVLRDLFQDLPVEVNIDTENIGGPSAGLMFTLSIVDKLTSQDLTGGRRIAGTGAIELDGSVLPVGGVAEKLVAVDRQGVSIFLIPGGNCGDVRGRVPDGLRLVKVSSLQEALRFLRQPGATATAPGC
jgi:PDZ domain-containing protein